MTTRADDGAGAQEQDDALDALLGAYGDAVARGARRRSSTDARAAGRAARHRAAQGGDGEDVPNVYVLGTRRRAASGPTPSARQRADAGGGPEGGTTAGRGTGIGADVAAYGLCGAAGAGALALGLPGLAFAVLIIALPAAVVAGWFVRESRLGRAPVSFRVPRDVPGWSRVLLAHSQRLDARAGEIRRTRLQIDRLVRFVGELRSLGVPGTDADDLVRHLTAARACLQPLEHLVSGGGADLRAFAVSCVSDPTGTGRDTPPVPQSLDSDAAALCTGRALSYLSLASAVGGGRPRLEDLDHTARIALEVRALLTAVRRLDAVLDEECREALHAADVLHQVASTEALAAFRAGWLVTAVARAALAAVVSVRRPRAVVVRTTVRASVRAEFLRHGSSRPGSRVAWVPGATVAAFRRGRHVRHRGTADVDLDLDAG